MVGRRPYDIGDRIVIADKVSDQVPPMSMSWIVEGESHISGFCIGISRAGSISPFSDDGAKISHCSPLHYVSAPPMKLQRYLMDRLRMQGLQTAPALGMPLSPYS